MDSIWINSIPEVLDSHRQIDSDLSCDVTIIGGGITGLTCRILFN